VLALHHDALPVFSDRQASSPVSAIPVGEWANWEVVPDQKYTGLTSALAVIIIGSSHRLECKND
jgi:hypothetical protein